MRIHPLGTMDTCAKVQGNPDSFCDISVWMEVVGIFWYILENGTKSIDMKYNRNLEEVFVVNNPGTHG